MTMVDPFNEHFAILNTGALGRRVRMEDLAKKGPVFEGYVPVPPPDTRPSW